MIIIMIIARHGTFQLDGNTLDNFAELKTVEGLKEGSLVKVVEEPYTMREARFVYWLPQIHILLDQIPTPGSTCAMCGTC
jgi:hypothetical protein